MTLVLGIETSCDETGLAILEFQSDDTVEVKGEVLSSQVALHQAYGGVVPELAAREHLRNLPFLLSQLLDESQLTVNDLDCIGVTQGPGLKGCLLMGLHFARGLCLAHRKPLIGVNHIEGHIWASGIESKLPEAEFLALVVSGGHTEIQLVRSFGDYQVIARTIDDAAGEAFDKSAQLLGFDYPGGPALSKLADSVNNTTFVLPKVMRGAEGFSFSGLKTAIALLIKASDIQDTAVKAELCFAVQAAIIDALVYKLQQAIKKLGVYNVILTGGVAANSTLRRAIEQIPSVNLFCPSPKYCTDNGAMIAYVAGRRFKLGQSLAKGESVYARWPIEQMGGNV